MSEGTADQPPAVVVDEVGAAAVISGERVYQLRWNDIRRVTIDVMAVPDADYAEGFWHIETSGEPFAAPIEVVVGAEEFTERLFALPGFDQDAYRRALDAESRFEEGEFLCWAREPRVTSE